ncbi:hypothetical protein [Balneola vulgaris]|uniref:hypothetical protein n=1 Tax=Balneola vulgaris TaxID=287535 RepID=UPI000374E36C|nr:hypothetical protein [Balneola vulgaris]
MLKLILGLIATIIGVAIILKTYMNWRKHNSGFRESKKASPTSDHSFVGLERGYIFGAFLLISGLYFVVGFFQ